MTPEFRVSFASVFAPTAFMDQKAKYSLVMLFDKSQDISALKELANKTVIEKWPDKEKRPKNLRNPFRDGDEEKPDVPGYENTIFTTCSSLKKPQVVDIERDLIFTEDEFYSGCFARATLTCFAYPSSPEKDRGNRGVAFGLQNVQKLRDGEPFTGRSSAAEDFSEDTTGEPSDSQANMFS